MKKRLSFLVIVFVCVLFGTYAYAEDFKEIDELAKVKLGSNLEDVKKIIDGITLDDSTQDYGKDLFNTDSFFEYWFMDFNFDKKPANYENLTRVGVGRRENFNSKKVNELIKKAKKVFGNNYEISLDVNYKDVLKKNRIYIYMVWQRTDKEIVQASFLFKGEDTVSYCSLKLFKLKEGETLNFLPISELTEQEREKYLSGLDI
nr:hypothetical protein 14 [bacterium]